VIYSALGGKKNNKTSKIYNNKTTYYTIVSSYLKFSHIAHAIAFLPAY